MNYYEVLGLTASATEEAIKDAYRKLVKQYHPDINNSPEAAQKIVAINEAYEILSDPTKRHQYDSGGVYIPLPVEEEDPREKYRREFLQKKREDAIKAKEEKLRQRKLAFRIFRVISFPLFCISLFLLIDYWIPSRSYQEVAETGWQDRLGGSRHSQGELVSFMKTKSFAFDVPHELGLSYDYYADKKVPLTIEVTPMLKTVKTVSIKFDGEYWKWKSTYTIYTHWPFLPYLLFFSALFVILRRDFSEINYWMCFMPAMVFSILLMIYFLSPV